MAIHTKACLFAVSGKVEFPGEEERSRGAGNFGPAEELESAGRGRVNGREVWEVTAARGLLPHC